MGEGKKTISRVFGSLVNNATAIDGAKYSPWWVGFILFILGLLTPVIPIFVNAANTNGTTFLQTAEYGLGLETTFGKAINDLDGILTYDDSLNIIDYTSNKTYSEDDTNLIGGYIATSGNYKDQYLLRIYYAGYSEQADMKAFVESKEAIAYTKGTTTKTSADSENAYIPTSIYFFKSSFFMDLYATNTTTKATDMGFYSDLTCYEGKSDLKQYFVGNNFDFSKESDRLDSFKNLKTFIDNTYKSTKTRMMSWGTLLYVGIYALLNFFMGLMLFIMTRGKKNPNNYLSFWTCLKIDWWASLCPGLISMCLGFIFISNAVMFEVMLLAMRMVWLSSKEFRPQ